MVQKIWQKSNLNLWKYNWDNFIYDEKKKCLKKIFNNVKCKYLKKTNILHDSIINQVVKIFIFLRMPVKKQMIEKITYKLKF